MSSDKANTEFARPTKKVKHREFMDFASEYFHTQMFHNQRFGQAFFNYFAMGGSDPEVYYSDDVRETTKMIMRRYVEID